MHALPRNLTQNPKPVLF